MNGRMLVMLATCGLLFGGIFGYKWFGNRMMNEFLDAAPVPPATVSSAKAYADVWSLSLSAVGTVRAVRGTDVTTEASGIIDSIQFESGDEVAAGDVLVTLDRSTDLAELAALDAAAALAEQDLSRVESLIERNAVSRSELDSRSAAAAAARASVNAQRARIAQKVIRAPFDGQLGIRRVDLGRHISPGDAIVSLQSLDPIHVNFKLPQQQLVNIHTGMQIRARLEFGGHEPFEGTITAIEPAIDTSTRTFEAQATLANAERVLRPGMFVRVEIVLGRDEDVVVVPQTAVSFNPYGDSVWVLAEADDGGLVAEQRVVQTGRRRGDLVQITDGLEPDEEVATSGLLKLRNGISVNINNAVLPSAETAPEPPNR